MIKRTVFAFVGGIGVLLSGIAQAQWLSPPNVPEMAAASDVIVVGRASGAQAQGSRGESFLVTVDRVLKGSPPRPLTVRLDLSDYSASAVGEGQYGVFFLRSGTGSFYAVVDPSHAALPALAASPQRASGAGKADALTAVTAELAQVLALNIADQNVPLDAADALRSIPSKTAGPPLAAIAESGRDPARLWAIACLFAIDQTDDPVGLGEHYLSAAAPALRDPAPQAALAIDALAHAIGSYVRSPDVVPALTSLLASRSPALRRAASSALGDVATGSAVLSLAKMALNDPDWDVRYQAVLGLAAATGIGDRPTLYYYKRHEAQFITFWRRWATNLQ